MPIFSKMGSTCSTIKAGGQCGSVHSSWAAQQPHGALPLAAGPRAHNSRCHSSWRSGRRIAGCCFGTIDAPNGGCSRTTRPPPHLLHGGRKGGRVDGMAGAIQSDEGLGHAGQPVFLTPLRRHGCCCRLPCVSCRSVSGGSAAAACGSTRAWLGTGLLLPPARSPLNYDRRWDRWGQVPASATSLPLAASRSGEPIHTTPAARGGPSGTPHPPDTHARPAWAVPPEAVVTSLRGLNGRTGRLALASR